LGSIIEVFNPRAARAWRGSSVPGTGAPKVRAARLEDFAAIRALQRRSQPGAPAWTLKQLESQRQAFPEGQLVADAQGEVIGSASASVMEWDEERPAQTLYVSDVFVDAVRHGAGAARALYQAERRLCRKLNLRRVVASVPVEEPEIYVQRVIWGDIADERLRVPLSLAFQYCGMRGGDAILAWVNPLYSPDDPPANMEKERRKCA
jgi:predicted N-acetyltransferase YhbS